MRFRPAHVVLVAGLTLAAASCANDAPSAPGGCANVEILVAGASKDYRSSLLCGVPDGPSATSIELGFEPMLTTTNGRAFFLARDNDLLFELDPTCGNPTSRISLNRLKPDDRPANPHDVAAAADGTLIVPLYNIPRLAFVKDGKVETKIVDGVEQTTAIDLSGYDPDGNPQAESVRIVDVAGVAKAFVALERLDDNDYLRAKQPSQMLRVDVATRSVEAVVELAGRNPFNPMSEVAGALFLAEAGNFDSADDELAGIERFDTATSTTRLLVRERDLRGSVVEIAVTEGCGVAIIAGPQKTVNPTSVVSFDPTTGAILASIDAPILGPTPGYDLQGLAWRGDTLYVGDRRRGQNGYEVHVLERTAGCALRATGRTIVLPQGPVALRAAK